MAELTQRTAVICRHVGIPLHKKCNDMRIMRLRAILTQVSAADDINDHGTEVHCYFLFFPPVHLVHTVEKWVQPSC